ncbi:serine/threonine-protein kinase [Krasilnikovia cinnamomea]|uniref:non-specific serine/threonine protein kinase n=1 Tax=Krasilnikovia cinnamomea TaxID=349313 RepID=A0A4Q7ZGR2_9ACTN|nr:serine/threonine-protein kinase [Krasilnikovia cinnamomea]RZU49982.1 serine/threonine-protein kinase [Krasilnikovia cinnamomea]
MEAEQTLGGRYTLIDELGRGGMAVVWRARDEVLGRDVAVKVLAGRHTADPQSRARIRTEARAAATLSHPNIAQVHDYGESTSDGQCVPYVVMELISGVTLQERIGMGPLTPAQTFRICAQVAMALAAAHADGLVHRDIKPGNVMVTRAGAKVVDFGIAATAGPGEPEAELLGTPAYLAPERLTGDTVEPASDVYALGVLLYRLLAGDSPWRVESTTQLLSAHIYVEPSPLPELPRVPEFVVDLVNRCLRKDPTERPTAADAAAILARAEYLAERADAVPISRPARAEPSAAGLSAAALFGAGLPGGGPSDADQSGRAPSGADRSGIGGSGAGPLGTEGSGAGPSISGPAPAGPVEAAPAAEVPLRPAAAPGPPPRAASASTRPGSKSGQRAGSGQGAGSGRDSETGRRRRLRRMLVGGGVCAAAVAALSVWQFGPVGRAATDAAAPPSSAPGGAPPPGPGSSAAASAGGPPAPGRHAARPADAMGALPVDGLGRVTVAPTGKPTRRGTGPEAPRTTPPDEPATTTPAAEPSTDPPVTVRTLSSDGGSVEAQCSQGQAQLLSWNPVKPYKVDGVDAGPAQAASIVFRHGNRRIHMTVTCGSGGPSAEVS